MEFRSKAPYGYRAWRLRSNGLYSFSGWREWPTDRPKVALCWRNFLPVNGHTAPGKGHQCGIYAWKDVPPKTYSPQGMVPVWGVVELTGHVIEHSCGYRAQYARPVAIEYAPDVIAVARRYGLIVLDDMADWKE